MSPAVAAPQALPAGTFRAEPVAPDIPLSLGYQLTIGALLFGSVTATGHLLSPLALLGAVGANQVAGAVLEPNSASPRDAALVVPSWASVVAEAQGWEVGVNFPLHRTRVGHAASGMTLALFS